MSNNIQLSGLAAYLKRLYLGFEKRQRQQLISYGLILPLACGTLIPSNYYYLSQRKLLVDESRLFDWLSSLPPYDRETVTAVQKIKEKSLIALVIESAQTDSIVIDRINPKGETEVSCTVSMVMFDQFIEWIERFQLEHPYINLTYLSINRSSAENSQRISVNFTLSL